jgi:hypothetical protein
MTPEGRLHGVSHGQESVSLVRRKSEGRAFVSLGEVVNQGREGVSKGQEGVSHGREGVSKCREGISRVADPHHFNADPDPAFHFNADHRWSINPPGLHFEPSGLHGERPRPSAALF